MKSPICNSKSVIQGEKYRITILTSNIVRLEYNDKGIFEDRATQKISNRNFEVPDYKVIDEPGNLRIMTDCIDIVYTKEKFTKHSLSIGLRGKLGNYGGRWYYGTEVPMNLKGTARTLDTANGEIPLEDGIFSMSGYGIIDDSTSLVINEEGWVETRSEEGIDIYFLGFGNHYLEGLKAYYALSGETPMIPRYALGNWWSRYNRYTETEYKELMERFKREEIPFSVAVVDMDWHITYVDPKYGSGWTGYTWNKDLFPDPKEFMTWLHDENLKITLNLHPAEGVKGHEEMYLPMAKALGVDYENEEPIEFDITSKDFMNAYFKYLHHPNEEDGVDFWWIDWQQGNTTKVPGLDPLWMLNHYHYEDMKRNEKRPMIFSRFAGIGSQRYPIGFSGDTIVSWDSLDFQPYFTATASNVGYSWWSHDIGGHMQGVKNDELTTRWVQLGVFSPIMRLHSTCSPFAGKEPWNYGKEAEEIIKKYLRIRYKLLPYTYTMNYKNYAEGKPLIQPMYYKHPTEGKAYQVKNEYYFGDNLIVYPITQPMHKELRVGKVKAWLPQGTWIDVFNGRIYEGDRTLTLYRNLEQMPVLTKVGSIIPLSDLTEYSNSVANPESMEIQVFAGDNGSFTLYEDDGETMAYEKGDCVTTEMTFNWEKDAVLTIKAAQGNQALIPAKRHYKFTFRAIEDCETIKVTVDGKEVPFEKAYCKETQSLYVTVQGCDVMKEVQVTLVNGSRMAQKDRIKELFEFLHWAQMSFDKKNMIFDLVRKHIAQKNKLMGELSALELDKDLLGALEEIILA